MNNSYTRWSTAYDKPSTDPYTSKQVAAFYPFQYNWWRENPLSDNTLIRNNVAGSYPQVIVKRDINVTPEVPYEHTYQFVCSTIFPKSPEFVKTNQIIPQP
jgi:hypothetical protein